MRQYTLNEKLNLFITNPLSLNGMLVPIPLMQTRISLEPIFLIYIYILNESQRHNSPNSNKRQKEKNIFGGFSCQHSVQSVISAGRRKYFSFYSF